MSYLVLARKYRPRTFDDMVGQETTTGTLRGAIQENRVGHAYLFCGPRGTGKTTTARIFAKALICEKGPTPDPCGTCERCIAADDQSEIDIIEIDAASNTGVDDVRGLRDQVAYAPMRARFKIYIVDEVHMLSKAAFNAFLKTLEEPPPHVKFLFATTDPQKLPETVISRCQILKLAPLSEKTISARLGHIFGIEGVAAESGVAEEIARRARGGMRDALSMADQLLSLVGSNPTLADVARLAEGGGTREIEQLIERIEAHDRAGMLRALPRTEGSEADLVAALLDTIRGALLAHVAGAESGIVEGDAERRLKLSALGERLGLERAQVWLEELIQCRERIRTMPAHGRVVLEVTLLDLCREETSWSVGEVLQRLKALEHAVSSGQSRVASDVVVPRPPPAPATKEPARAAGGGASLIDPVAPAPVVDTRAPASGSLTSRPRGTAEVWTQFLETLVTSSSSLAETLRQRGKLADMSPGRAVIQLSNLREHERVQIHDPRNQKLCQAAFSKLHDAPTQVVFEDQSAVRQARDPYTAKVAELFDGRIEDEG